MSVCGRLGNSGSQAHRINVILTLFLLKLSPRFMSSVIPKTALVETSSTTYILSVCLPSIGSCNGHLNSVCPKLTHAYCQYFCGCNLPSFIITHSVLLSSLFFDPNTAQVVISLSFCFLSLSPSLCPSRYHSSLSSRFIQPKRPQAAETVKVCLRFFK